MEKKLKVTIEYDGDTVEIEGYALMGSVIQYEKDAPVQSVTMIHNGRLSKGDFLSHAVAAIAEARKQLNDLPKEVRDAMLQMAIEQGLQGGLRVVKQ